LQCAIFNLKLYQNVFSGRALSGHAGKNYSAVQTLYRRIKKREKEGGEGKGKTSMGRKMEY